MPYRLILFRNKKQKNIYFKERRSTFQHVLCQIKNNSIIPTAAHERNGFKIST